MRYALILLLMLLLPAAAQAQQSSPDPSRRAAMEARRDSLENAIMQRFLVQLTRELKLDDAQRTQTERVLREGAVRRRELMHASGDLRSRLHRALRSTTSTDAEFTRLVAEHETLRQRDADLWRREQDELARILTPRQRAHFLVQWVRFQDSVREIISQQMRGGGGSERPH
jgi:Spy/CpxP family protein refolding chaperone